MERRHRRARGLSDPREALRAHGAGQGLSGCAVIPVPCAADRTRSEQPAGRGQAEKAASNEADGGSKS
ncbi:hypothetical protein EASAB2608_00313 [Streptomyces sp. EAS-AB2608]|nr:hypothetical protein EASAB2608_00313 [Streptomyces sp. EAS-AB2608]CUW32886.1 hypothetical protein TUE45_pSRTUE45c_0254 [Streptomyces reticuli]